MQIHLIYQILSTNHVNKTAMHLIVLIFHKVYITIYVYIHRIGYHAARELQMRFSVIFLVKRHALRF